MTIINTLNTTLPTSTARRSFMGNSGALSAVAVAHLAADETMHFAILTNALGRPLLAGALSFGA